MGMKPTNKKPKSKRTPVRLRHKIEKASAAKQRKNRKEAKKNPEWRSRLKKGPGIPNLFPYKDRILREIEEKKAQKEEEQQRKIEEARLARKSSNSLETKQSDNERLSDADSLVDIDDDEAMDEGEDEANPMAALLASARARASEYEANPNDLDSSMDEANHDTLRAGKSRADPSSRAFSHLFPEILSQAEVILYVLDARDPPSTRSIPTERQIAAYEGGSRRLILVLNKIDLVPPKVLQGWLTFLRRYHPTVPLNASSAAPNAKVYDHKRLTQKATSDTLLKALKSYAASRNLGRAITVGVVGFPNVGKSSVINTLVARLGRGSAPVTVGAEAGVTTAIKKVKLDKKLILLDSPGVVFPETENSSQLSGPGAQEATQARLVLLNALPPKAITDPIPAIRLLLSRLSSTPSSLDLMLDSYGIPPLMKTAGDTVTDFLVQVARKRGRLGKGGVPNLEAAAMAVLADWRDGRITCWVEPPALSVKNNPAGDEEATENQGDEKEIVNTWAQEFKIEGLWGSREEDEALMDM